MLFKRGKRRYKKARLIFIWIPIATPWHSARSHKTIMFGFRIPPLGFLRFEQRSRSKRRSRNVTTTLVACIYRRLFITPVSPTVLENLATRSLKSLNDIAFSISRSHATIAAASVFPRPRPCLEFLCFFITAYPRVYLCSFCSENVRRPSADLLFSFTRIHVA